MKKQTKEKLANAARWAAMLTPPYNIVCWAIGLGIYVKEHGFRAGYDDNHGDDFDDDENGFEFLHTVIAAPITLPFRAQNLRLQRERDELAAEHVRLQDEARDIIVRHVLAAGGRIDQTANWDSGLFLRAELTTVDQIEAFRLGCAEAVRTLGARIPSERLLEHVKPNELLDELWARGYGLDEWFGPALSAPCTACGKVEVEGLIYSHAARAEHTAHSADQRLFFTLPSGAKFVHDGHLCRDCQPPFNFIGVGSRADFAGVPGRERE